MTAVAPRWLWQASGCPPLPKSLPIAFGPCRLCGEPGTYAANRAMADTFNDLDILARPDSPALCPGCAWYLLDSRHWRAGNWRITPDTVASIPREQLRAELAAALVTPPVVPTCYAIAPSQTARQKHTHLLRCPVNAAGATDLRVQVGEGTALLARAPWLLTLQAIDALLALGHRKSEIDAGKLSAQSLIGHRQWEEAQGWMQTLRPWVGGPELELALYATIIEKEDAAA